MRWKFRAGSIFDVCNILFFILLSIIMIYPLWSVLMTSLVSNAEFFSRPVILWPRHFVFESYKAIFQDQLLIHSLFVTIIITIVGTLYSMLMTVMLAYGLSKDNLMGGKFFRTLVIVTMYFNGGIVPYYLLIKNLHLRDTIWVMILPMAINAWNYLVVRTFFRQLPESLDEAAKIDGANDLHILFRIILPLSAPVLATFSLFYGIEYWNSWWFALLFISDNSLHPLQYVLREMVISNSSVQSTTIMMGRNLFEEGVKMATVIVATVPIICVYPFLQKYFTKGVILGAIKE
ncbi:putative aldouronate transport system permease protein [Paenibacillus sp. yr247]|uniref:carbohydrate ABC transporter permease n=1 Tax=Paenibacillus sp. yr247 TaxID=1761880 RepID=UPI00088CE920|nr:carbohydrate ABC transporter permease [Paenibacillus sp. yr247]SDN97165.1 putative aldouronate transport system permease protein [Paenibacillus sp. yr247]